MRLFLAPAVSLWNDFYFCKSFYQSFSICVDLSFCYLLSSSCFFKCKEISSFELSYSNTVTYLEPYASNSLFPQDLFSSDSWCKSDGTMIGNHTSSKLNGIVHASPASFHRHDNVLFAAATLNLK